MSKEKERKEITIKNDDGNWEITSGNVSSELSDEQYKDYLKMKENKEVKDFNEYFWMMFDERNKIANERRKKLQNNIIAKLESIKFELIKESLENIKKTIIEIYSEEFVKFDNLGFVSLKGVKDYFDGKTDEPFDFSNEGIGAYWNDVLKTALIKEIVKKIDYRLYRLDALIDYNDIKQIYKNIFKTLKSKEIKKKT